MNRRYFLFALFLLACVSTSAQVALNSDGRDAEYVKSIVDRSQKIVDKLNLTDAGKAENVRNIIANRYFKLNDIYANRDAKLKFAKDSLSGNAKKEAQIQANNECDAMLYKCHPEFAADLSQYIDNDKIEAVKDGMTYGVVKVTYDATLEMIPTLKEEEKVRILSWLKEAREFAMDAENSKKKHGWFGKYKGRINNYLAKRGYDLKKEREEWYKRIEAKKAQKK